MKGSVDSRVQALWEGGRGRCGGLARGGDSWGQGLGHGWEAQREHGRDARHGKSNGGRQRQDGCWNQKRAGGNQRGAVESTEQKKEDELAKTLDALSSNARKILRLVGSELCDLKKILQFCHEIDNAREKRKFSEVEKDVQVLVPKFAKLYRSIEDVEIKGYANLEAVALRAVAL